MKHFFTGCLMLAAVQYCAAQVTVSGRAAFLKTNGEKITVVRPVGPFASNSFVTDTGSNTKIRSGGYRVVVPLKQPGWISIRSKDLGTVDLFAFPNDHFQIEYQNGSDSLHIIRLRISGNNAAGQLLYHDRGLLNGGPVIEKSIDSLLRRVKTPVEAMDSIAARLSLPLDALQRLARHRQITTAFEAQMRAQTEQQMLFWDAGFLTGWLYNDKVRTTNPLRIDRNQVIQLLVQLFKRFDPFNDRYIHSNVLSFTLAMKCIAIANGILPTPRSDARAKWAPFDPEIKQITDAFSEAVYAPAKQAAMLMGEDLIMAAHFHVASPIHLGASARLYLATYPHSPYNDLLRQRLADAIAAMPAGTKVPMSLSADTRKASVSLTCP